jgi:hypothetical protein
LIQVAVSRGLWLRRPKIDRDPSITGSTQFAPSTELFESGQQADGVGP